jgi:RNA recognition motif-containing protein
VDEEKGEDIERSTSPNNGAGKGKEKVKLSLAEFISTVGGSEDGTETEDEIPSRILWVGNIGSDVTEEELTTEFSAYGKLESLRILHPRFCAFVNFEEEECAKKAKIGLQGTIIGSQYIVIKYRKPETKPATGAIIGTPGSDNSFVLNAPSRALWIGNISDEVTEEDLYIEFSQFGEIESVRLLTHKTCAFVNFMTVDDATNALHALQGRELGNMPIKINFGKPPKSNQNLPFGAPYMPSFMPQPYYPDYHYPPPYPYATPMPPYLPMEPQYPMYLPPSNICDFCGVNVKDTAVVPCSHSFCCNECIPKFRATSPDKGAKCAYCQGNIEKIVPITFPTMNAYNPYYHPAMVMQDYPPQ